MGVTLHGFTRRSVKKSSEKRSKTRAFYRRYLSQRQRCNNKNASDYKYYGGRGIRSEWNSFNEFYRDMWDSFLINLRIHGLKNTTLDRINVNKNYCKSNCRWATRLEQGKNTRRCRLFTVNGVTKTLRQWAIDNNINDSTMRRRIDLYKWPIELAVTTPAVGIRGKFQIINGITNKKCQ